MRRRPSRRGRRRCRGAPPQGRNRVPPDQPLGAGHGVPAAPGARREWRARTDVEEGYRQPTPVRDGRRSPVRGIRRRRPEPTELAASGYDPTPVAIASRARYALRGLPAQPPRRRVCTHLPGRPQQERPDRVPAVRREGRPLRLAAARRALRPPAVARERRQRGRPRAPRRAAAERPRAPRARPRRLADRAARRARVARAAGGRAGRAARGPGRGPAGRRHGRRPPGREGPPDRRCRAPRRREPRGAGDAAPRPPTRGRSDLHVRHRRRDLQPLAAHADACSG